MNGSLNQLVEATSRFLHSRGADQAAIEPTDAICQDLMILGIDVEGYVNTLEAEFGPVVWDVPWLRFSQIRPPRFVTGAVSFSRFGWPVDC